jgi:hypothetical protein
MEVFHEMQNRPGTYVPPEPAYKVFNVKVW